MLRFHLADRAVATALRDHFADGGDRSSFRRGLEPREERRVWAAAWRRREVSGPLAPVEWCECVRQAFDPWAR